MPQGPQSSPNEQDHRRAAPLLRLSGQRLLQRSLGRVCHGGRAADGDLVLPRQNKFQEHQRLHGLLRAGCRDDRRLAQLHGLSRHQRLGLARSGFQRGHLRASHDMERSEGYAKMESIG